MKKGIDAYETVVVGGGVAGLTAALVLARANRRVLLVDNHRQSNLVSQGAHGVFGHDKAEPGELYRAGRGQLGRYPTAKLLDDTVTAIAKHDAFAIMLEGGSTVTANSVILAQGIEYGLPDIPGLQELWGTKVWHCPFCDGYEAAGAKLLVISTPEEQDHYRKLLPIWTEDIVVLAPDEIASLRSAPAGITANLKNGKLIEAAQCITQINPRQRDGLAESLGCKRNESGGFVLDSSYMTSVGGVYIAGDQSQMMPSQINLAVAAGQTAGAAIVNKIAGT